MKTVFCGLSRINVTLRSTMCCCWFSMLWPLRIIHLHCRSRNLIFFVWWFSLVYMMYRVPKKMWWKRSWNRGAWSDHIGPINNRRQRKTKADDKILRDKIMLSAQGKWRSAFNRIPSGIFNLSQKMDADTKLVKPILYPKHVHLLCMWQTVVFDLLSSLSVTFSLLLLSFLTFE